MLRRGSLRRRPRELSRSSVREHSCNHSGALDRGDVHGEVAVCRPIEDVRVVGDPAHPAQLARVRLGVIVVAVELAVARPDHVNPSRRARRNDEGERLQAHRRPREMERGADTRRRRLTDLSPRPRLPRSPRRLERTQTRPTPSPPPSEHRMSVNKHIGDAGQTHKQARLTGREPA